MVKKKLEHDYRVHYKIFTSASSEEVEKQVNSFSNVHNVVSVDVKPHSLDQSGTLLCDRVDPDRRTALLYVATVGYRVDYTYIQMDSALDAWITNKVRDYFGDLSKQPQSFKSVPTGNRITQKELVLEYIGGLRQSDEYKKVRDMLEEKFSMKPEKKPRKNVAV